MLTPSAMVGATRVIEPDCVDGVLLELDSGEVFTCGGDADEP